MWKDEFLPSIKREIGDRAVTNQASSHCSEDLTISRICTTEGDTVMSTLRKRTNGED